MSGIRVITIEREYGCGGGEIARKLAERLGWKLWDQLLTCEIARLSHCAQSVVQEKEERQDPLYYRLFKSLLRGSFEGSTYLHRVKLLDADSIVHITSGIILKAAEEGNCVIVGRGSQNFLRDRSDTLRIFLYAPREEKVHRIMAGGVGASEAEELVDTIDSERAAFIEKYFHKEWPNRGSYHALLNTTIGDDSVIETIVGLKARLEKESHEYGKFQLLRPHR